MNFLETLQKKNWSKKDKEHFARMLYRGESKKSFMSRFLYAVNYWLILFIILIGNVVLSFVLVPLFIIADELTLSFFLIVLGLAFGLFTDLIIYHIENVREQYYAMIIGFLPILVMANVFIVTMGSNLWAGIMNIPSGIHSPVFVSLLYGISYMLPFFYRLYKLYGVRREAVLVE